jgi:hypothetical protein
MPEIHDGGTIEFPSADVPEGEGIEEDDLKISVEVMESHVAEADRLGARCIPGGTIKFALLRGPRPGCSP